MRGSARATRVPAPADGSLSAVAALDEHLAGHGPSTRAPEPPQFDAFYRLEMPRLVALARALCGSTVADDLAQEAMLAAYRRWPEVSTYDRPEAWVRRVCANHATSHLRRRGAETRAVLRLSGRAPEPAPLDDRHEAFWAEVRRLPRRQAQAAALRYVYDLSLFEIAATMQCSEGSVKVHLSRARAALASAFREEVSR